MPDATFALLKRFAERTAPPSGPPGGPHEENCRAWTRALAEQCAFSFPDQGYGCKRAGAGRPLSKDCLAMRAGSGLIGWDCLTGAGTGRPTIPPAPPDAHDLAGQVFEPVAPVDHLGLGGPHPTVPVPDERTRPTTPAPIDLAPVLADLAALQHALTDVRAGIDALRGEIGTLRDRLADGAVDASVIRAAIQDAGWPVEIKAGVLGALSGWVGRRP